MQQAKNVYCITTTDSNTAYPKKGGKYNQQSNAPAIIITIYWQYELIDKKHLRHENMQWSLVNSVWTHEPIFQQRILDDLHACELQVSASKIQHYRMKYSDNSSIITKCSTADGIISAYIPKANNVAPRIIYHYISNL